MSFNRLKYDNYDLEINKSIGPGEYRMLNDFGENTNYCFSYNGPIGSKSDVSLSNDIIDVESELSWRRKPLSKDNSDDLDAIKSFKTFNKKNCSKYLISEDTRFTHPLTSYRSMSITDLQLQPYLPINPQSNIQDINKRIGVNSRLDLKDNYTQPDQTYLDNFTFN